MSGREAAQWLLVGMALGLVVFVVFVVPALLGGDS